MVGAFSYKEVVLACGEGWDEEGQAHQEYSMGIAGAASPDWICTPLRVMVASCVRAATQER